MLANAKFPVPGARVPLATAGNAVGATDTLTGGTLSTGLEFGHYGIGSERGDLSDGGHPAGKVGFEGRLVVVTGQLGFTRDFDHDFTATVLIGEEGVEATKHALNACLPGRVPIGLQSNEHLARP